MIIRFISIDSNLARAISVGWSKSSPMRFAECRFRLTFSIEHRYLPQVIPDGPDSSTENGGEPTIFRPRNGWETAEKTAIGTAEKRSSARLALLLVVMNDRGEFHSHRARHRGGWRLPTLSSPTLDGVKMR
jgi:hypothetical protein